LHETIGQRHGPGFYVTAGKREGLERFRGRFGTGGTLIARPVDRAHGVAVSLSWLRRLIGEEGIGDRILRQSHGGAALFRTLDQVARQIRGIHGIPQEPDEVAFRQRVDARRRGRRIHVVQDDRKLLGRQTLHFWILLEDRANGVNERDAVRRRGVDERRPGDWAAVQRRFVFLLPQRAPGPVIPA